VSATTGTAATAIPGPEGQGTIDGSPDGTGFVHSFLTDSGVALPGEGRLEMAVDIHFPKQLVEPAVMLVCLPGGGISRRYFDLQSPESHDVSFSFARHMTARGFIVALVDHLGIGDSSRPKDGYALSSDVLSQAADHVHGAIRAQVQAQYGNAFAHPFSIGVGHSMGGMITVLQQAQHHTHEAIVLLGFSTRGLPEYVPQPLHGLARDPVALRAQLAAHARQMFKEEPYPRLQPTAESREMFAGDRADARGVAALKLAGDEPVLPVPGFHAILPDNVAPEAASIDVPVFVAVGELDIVGPPGEVTRAFERSRAVVSYVMPNTGHCHFLFASRFALFEAIAAWTRLVAQRGA
jgi:pimeloyl-ACP methyl ester carboxylesterase